MAFDVTAPNLVFWAPYPRVLRPRAIIALALEDGPPVDADVLEAEGRAIYAGWLIGDLMKHCVSRLKAELQAGTITPDEALNALRKLEAVAAARPGRDSGGNFRLL